MKALKIIGIITLVLVIIGIVVILMQPSKVHVEKSIVINGTPAAITEEIESFQSFNAWSPWSKASPETHYTIVAFEDFAGTFYSDIKLEPKGEGTKVTWIYDGNNDGLKSKAMWILMKGNLNEQYDAGLKTLKRIVEKKSLSEESSSASDSTVAQ
jgi:hypothetical protein